MSHLLGLLFTFHQGKAMPAFGNLVVNDGTANRTFGPSRIDPKTGSASHENRAGGIPVGNDIIDVQVIRGTGSSTVDRVVINIATPTLAQTSPSTSTGIQPVPSVAYVHRSKHEFWMPRSGTLAERTVSIALSKNTLGHATVDTVLKTLESIY